MSEVIDKVDINTWKKVENTAFKAGFREGISDGRDANFQGSFDDGYKRGFESGFTLGFYKGALSLQEDKKCNEVLKQTTRGNCEICTDTNFDNELISTLDERQKKILQNVITQLKEEYPGIKEESIGRVV